MKNHARKHKSLGYMNIIVDGSMKLLRIWNIRVYFLEPIIAFTLLLGM